VPTTPPRASHLAHTPAHHLAPTPRVPAVSAHARLSPGRKLSQAGCPAPIRTRIFGTASVQNGKAFVVGSVTIQHTNPRASAYGISSVAVTISNSQGLPPVVTSAYCSPATVAAGGLTYCSFTAELPGALSDAPAWSSVRATATVGGGSCNVAAVPVQQTQSVG